MKPWKSEAQDCMLGVKSGFNGATAMKPWKRSHWLAVKMERAQLQWGHGDEAVEELIPGGNLLGQIPASMGPRR